MSEAASVDLPFQPIEEAPVTATMLAMLSLSVPNSVQNRISRQSLWDLAACLAIAAPVSIAPNLPPTATFLNQALALFGWGLLLAVMAGALPKGPLKFPVALRSALLALALLFSAALASPWWTGLPPALALTAAGLLAAAAFTATIGAAMQQAGLATQAFRSLCIGMLVAALINACIAYLQVYAPQWVDGRWIANAVVEGRAVGNLRQSNHLCSVLLWGIVAAAWLGETRVLHRTLVSVVAVALMGAVVLSSARSGVLGAVMLAVWGLLDRRLGRRTRTLLLLAPIAYALLWSGAAALAHQNQQVFGGESRFSGAGDISSSRFGIWQNTLALIQSQPWLGVGFGEFNLAWSLTEFPGRPIAFFDHSHNVLLQFAVELGLPLATLVIALLGYSMWIALKRSLDPIAPGAAASPLRPAVALLALVLMHSMLEYPLWYAYFLLPTGFVLGLCLGESRDNTAMGDPVPRAPGDSSPLRPVCLVLTLGAALSVFDYFRVVPIFTPPNDAAPLKVRIATGQGSLLFSYHADYAAAVNIRDSKQALSAAQRAGHNLLDTRLMMAWANALHATGDTERAKHIAQRLVEFRRPESDAYFAPCRDAALADTAKPYQCFAPIRKFTYKDFQ